MKNHFFFLMGDHIKKKIVARMNSTQGEIVLFDF